MIRRTLILLLSAAAVLAFSLLIACGGGTKQQLNAQGTVNITLSDPPTCSASTPATGPFSAIWVTVKDVQISTNGNAGPNDSSWVDLTPNLKNAPVQVNLLDSPKNGCFLSTLGTAGIPAGTYQQIRLVLTATDTPSNGDACGKGMVNCVVPTLGTPQPLLLSSEATTGLKIPSGQIAGGAFTIAAGETKDLNIDLDGCDSVVMQGSPTNPVYRLKPVVRAGEVSMMKSTAITGSLVDQDGKPITTGKAMVLLEQRDTNNVDRKVLQLTTDVAGNFSLCPVPDGTYDVVAVAITETGAYGPTIISGVTPGTSLGQVKLALTPASGSNPSTLAANLKGNVTTAPNGADVVLSALQPLTINGVNLQITVPLAQEQSWNHKLTTACSGGSCTGTYSLQVPAANFWVGTLGTNGVTFPAAPTNTNVTYSVEAATTTCTAPAATQTATPTNAVAPGIDVNMTPVAFTSCQ